MLQPFELAGMAVEPAADGGFHAFGGVRRQKRCQGGLHDQGLRDALSPCVVGKLGG